LLVRYIIIRFKGYGNISFIFLNNIVLTKNIVGIIMLNKIWSVVLCLGILICFLKGDFSGVSNTFIDAGGKAVELCIFMAGTMSFWCGIMNVAEKSGLVDIISRIIKPVIKFLFPDIPPDSKAFRYICLNMVSNFIGIGWASTPAGIKAMHEMKKLNKDKNTASKDMCMFIIINVSSLQILPFNILALRQKFMSSEPFIIVLPAIIATALSTLIAVIMAKIFERGINNES